MKELEAACRQLLRDIAEGRIDVKGPAAQRTIQAIKIALGVK